MDQPSGVRSARLLAVLVIAFLGVQLTLPLLVGRGEGQRPLGWQMFSFATPRPEFVLIDADGTETPIDQRDHLATERVELDYVTLLPPHLCATTDAVVVLVGPDREPHPC